MQEFPFEKVYEKLAEPLCENNMKGKGFHPCVLFIKCEEDGFQLRSIPLEISALMLSLSGMKNLFDAFSKLTNEDTIDNDQAIVVVTMGRIKVHPKSNIDYSDEEITEYMKTLDPETDDSFNDCMIIAIHHQTGVKMMHLPILDDGTIQYQKWESAHDVKFVPVSEDDIKQAKTKH